MCVVDLLAGPVAVAAAQARLDPSVVDRLIASPLGVPEARVPAEEGAGVGPLSVAPAGG